MKKIYFEDKLIEVSIGIAAYNAEANILRLVESLFAQNELNYVIKKIIINSDASSDNTIAILNKIHDARLQVIDSKVRLGFANSVKELLTINNSDIIILLNDDILIKDDLFISKTIAPILTENNIGLMCCNLQPINPKNFIENAVSSGYWAYKKMSLKTNNGNNIFTCDGKVMIFQRKFIKAITYPKNIKRMGNVDGYMYFECLKKGFKYYFSIDSKVYFKFPSTINDFTKWQLRNYANRYILIKEFGNLANNEFRIPKVLFSYFRLIEFLKNPFGSLFIFILGFYVSIIANIKSKKFETTWDLVKTTKELDININN